MSTTAGSFVISLDFELYWGVRDHRSLNEYGANIIGGRKIIPSILEEFEKHQIHSTWAIVGFLLCRNKKEMCEAFPSPLPEYQNSAFSPYEYINNTEFDNLADHHFAPTLIQKIKNCPNQELGTHTLSHFYCIERGIKEIDFENDLRKAIELSEKNGLTTKSIIFPRNQIMYIDTLNKLKIGSYRGNETHWAYQPTNSPITKPFKRILKLVDRYFNLLGHHTYKIKDVDGVMNIPSSRFLAPIKKSLPWLNRLHIRRILAAMTYAAKNNQVYHLWWHPHNFGIHQEENLNQLKKILNHYKILQEQFNFKSLNMSELADSQCKVKS